jgi:alcohol dehydrogenase (cytochrome c)
MKKWKRWSLAGAIVIALVVGVLSIDAFRWRAQVVRAWARGDIREVTGKELWFMLKPSSGFWLKSLVEGRGLSAAVRNPLVTPADIAAGGKVFRQRCAQCHGGSGHGGLGPALERPPLKQGDSDWAIYRNLQHGIPGTGMVAMNLEIHSAWQVVGFIRSLQSKAAAGGAERVAQSGRTFSPISFNELLAADQQRDSWLMYSRTYDGQRFAPQTEINAGNVGKLRLKWMYQFDPPNPGLEVAPVVANGIAYVTVPPGSVYALDVRTGEIVWEYHKTMPDRLSLCCGQFNRGVAILGRTIFVGTLDAHLLALDALTGELRWDLKLGLVAEGYSLTGAPLVVRDTVITGISGGEFGIRGFVMGVDAASGRERWRFNTVPGPGEPGNETWAGDSWKTGGAPTWVTGSYDPATDLIFWGVGNPSPDYNGDLRKGDNLYSNSVIALHAQTGRLAWHYQFTPHDEHDWDATQVPVLADVKIDGANVPAMLWANRNGFYYVLDRRTGKFLHATPFVEQTWSKGFTAAGRPLLNDQLKVTESGATISPGASGGTNWQSPSFNPRLDLLFVHAYESSAVFTKASTAPDERNDYELFVGSGSTVNRDLRSYVRAIDATTGRRVWQYEPKDVPRQSTSGLLATASNIVFGSNDDRFFALDARTGRELWVFPAGGFINAAPVSVEIDGHQLILIAAAKNVLAFGL